MNQLSKKASAISAGAVALTTSLPALAHSEHASILSGIVHFMTEPDHLAISGLAALVVILTVRKLAKNRV